MKSERKYWWFLFASAVVSFALAALFCSCSGDNATGGSDAVVATEVGSGDGLNVDGGADATSDAVGQDSSVETANNDGSAGEAGNDASTCSATPEYQQRCGEIAKNASDWKSPATYLVCGDATEVCPAARPNKLVLNGDNACVSCWDDCYAKWLPLIAALNGDSGKAVDVEPDVPYKELKFQTVGLGVDMSTKFPLAPGKQKAWVSTEYLKNPRFLFPSFEVSFSQCSKDGLYGTLEYDTSYGEHVKVEVWIIEKNEKIYIKSKLTGGSMPYWEYIKL